MAILDFLIFIEYRDHNRNWIRDGRPHGLLYFFPDEIPRSRAVLRGRWGVVHKLGLRWLFVKPEWIDKNERLAHGMLIIYRAIVFLNLILITTALLMVTWSD